MKLKTASALLLLESSLSRIYSHMTDGGFVMVTAFRSEYTHQENVQRNKELEKEIRRLGYAFFKVNGMYEETNANTGEKVIVKETTFFVPAYKAKEPVDDQEFKEDILGFLNLLEPSQEAALVKFPSDSFATLMDSEGGTITTFKDFVPNKVADIYTTIKGRTFTFESVERPGSAIGAYKMKAIGQQW